MHNKVFPVTYSASDAGSGVAGMSVQYQDVTVGGILGPWFDWKTNVSPGQDTFTGQDGHLYCFQSRAWDNAGNAEDWPGFAGYCVAVATASLRVTDVEVNQGILGSGYIIPRFAGRRTFVRCHVQSDDGQVYTGVPGRLRVMDPQSNTSLLIPPLNAGGVINVKPNPGRGALDDSYYYEIPFTWTSYYSELFVQCIVNSPLMYQDDDATDNTQGLAFNFSPQPAAHLHRLHPGAHHRLDAALQLHVGVSRRPADVGACPVAAADGHVGLRPVQPN